MYLALIDPGQVKILDLRGNEVFIANITENSFHWRQLFEYPTKSALKKEDLDRYKGKDKSMKEKAKTQHQEEIEEMAEEWLSFLARMKKIYVSLQEKEKEENEEKHSEKHSEKYSEEEDDEKEENVI